MGGWRVAERWKYIFVSYYITVFVFLYEYIIHVHIFTDLFSFAGSVHKSRDELLELGVIYSTFPIETGTYQGCQRASEENAKIYM